ncbi:hypothetical protein [uncultured Rothia sp.]|uniref:hypothetical protein n=1 Tax=uncultured Rothia sp. TaxID=316088 RepID=UPI00288A9DE9|nr:hypothetical protein [uncultured Rothia sp.]
MSQPNNQSIIGKALLKGTLMALTNACIIWLILYIANMDKSVLMVVAVVVAAAFGYVTAYFEARAALNAQEAQARHARGGDVSSSSSDGVDTSDSSDSSREEDDKDDFVDPGPDPDAGDFDAGSSSSYSSSDYSSYSSSDYSGGGDSGGGDSGGSSD